MSWSNVELFPLNENIHTLVQHLQAKGVAHRVIELDGKQALQVPNGISVASVQALIANWRVGSISPIPSNRQTKPFQQATMSLWRTPVTLLLVTISVFGFAIIEFEFLQFFIPFFTFYTLVSDPMAGINSGEYWRLLSPAFLHFGIFHIVFNALWIWDLGRRIEWFLGAKLYLLFFIVSAVVSNLVQHIWQTDIAQFGGMSGVVYAMVGYIAVCQKLNPHPVFNVPAGIIIFILAWLVLCLTGIVDMFMAGGIANGAHVGGLVAGVIIALLDVAIRKSGK